MSIERYRVVLDTNVIFEGLTKKRGTCGLLVDAWLAGLIQVCVSDALAYEYKDVLSRKLTPVKWQKAQTALKTLLLKASFISVHYTWRPASPDPGDDSVIDCAMNANALLITANVKDFRRAQAELGLVVMTPLEFVMMLAE
jgi:putative PIN family toxin of toxin-antitoxin system